MKIIPTQEQEREVVKLIQEMFDSGEIHEMIVERIFDEGNPDDFFEIFRSNMEKDPDWKLDGGEYVTELLENYLEFNYTNDRDHKLEKIVKKMKK